MRRHSIALIALLAVNAGIFALAELTTWLSWVPASIHGIAILFVILALTRLPVLWKPYDEPAGRFVRWMLFALLVFAGSHAIEFFTFRYGGMEYADSRYANVGNAYIVSLLAVIVGLEHILRRYYARPKMLLVAPVIAIAGGFVAIAGFLWWPHAISLGPSSSLPYLYTVLVLGLGIFGFVNLLEVKRLQPKLEGFARHMDVVLVLVVAAALISVLYGLLSEFFGFSGRQLVYSAHYVFYLGISVMYLAFGEPVQALAEQSKK
ncbi:MAG TPA: hypothetical protein VD862_02700 [Candidatus Paceibacterota bacterium]|nr:hypothetical protein [Candidatus Paceibacterota bacterium]